MVKYLTDIEAARMLAMPVSSLRKTKIHRCPSGYHVDIIKEYASTHGLPIGDWWNVIAMTSGIPEEHRTDEIVWVSDILEVFLKANEYTKAIILKGGDLEDTFHFICEHMSGTKLIRWGDGSGLCHIYTPTWQEAVHIGCQKI